MYVLYRGTIPGVCQITVKIKVSFYKIKTNYLLNYCKEHIVVACLVFLRVVALLFNPSKYTSLLNSPAANGILKNTENKCKAPMYIPVFSQKLPYL